MKFFKPPSSSDSQNADDIERGSSYFREIRSYSTTYLQDLKLMHDNPSIVREIIHFIIFKQEFEQNLFLKEITKEGFTTIGTFHQPNKEYPYSVEILRMDNTHPENVEQFIRMVTEYAVAHKGIYHCWETIALNDNDQYSDIYEDS